MSDKPESMDEQSLTAFIDNEIRNCIGYAGSSDEISEERARNLEYYLNRPRGDEEIGRSQLQDSTVHDVVESFLPGLLAPFISSDDLAEFLPVGLEDEAQAEEATKYTNHIVMKDNPGIRLLYQFGKDGLLQKNGFLYADWIQKDMSKRMQSKTDYAGLLKLTEDSEIEIIAVAAYDAQNNALEQVQVDALLDPEQEISTEGVCFEVDFRRSWKEGRVHIRGIPPEYALVRRTSTGCDDKQTIGWQEITTLSDLREEGYDEELLDKIPLAESANGRSIDHNGEREAREQAQGLTSTGGENLSSTKEENKPIWRTVLFTYVDYDGDGRAELRKIIRAGSDTLGGVTLYNEEVSEVRMISWTPIIMPHQFFGRAIVDPVIPVQDWKTALLRSAMNGVYDNTEPRYTVKEQSSTDDTWDDLMIRIPGSNISVKEQDAVQRLDTSPDLASTFQFMEMADQVRDLRSPAPRQALAVDPDVLNADKTATEATIQHNAIAQRQELILRLFAEAIAELCRVVHRLTIEHQDKPRIMRLIPDKPPVSVDPRYWNADMDVSVKVGLGTGTKDQQLKSLMMIHQIQMGDMQMGLPTVDPEKLFATRERLIQFSGLSSPQLYFNDPRPQDGRGNDPMLQKAYQDGVRAGQQNADAAAKLQIEREKIESKERMNREDIASEERMHQQDIALDKTELMIRQQENIAQAAGLNV